MKKIKLRNVNQISFNKIKYCYILPKHIDDTFEQYLIKFPEKNTATYRRKHYNILNDMLCHKNTFRIKYPDYYEHLKLHLHQFHKIQYIIDLQHNLYDLKFINDEFVFIYEEYDKPKIKLKNYEDFEKKCTYNLPNSIKYTLENAQLDLNKTIEYLYSTKSGSDLIESFGKIIKFNNERYITSGKKVKRIYSSFTDLSAELRKFLLIDNKPFHCFDIVAAQPSLLISILDKYKLPIDDYYKNNCHDLYDIIMEAAKFLNIEYENINEIVNNKYTGNSVKYSFSDRNDIKILLFRNIFFGIKSSQISNTAKIFNYLFPKTFDSLLKLKSILKAENKTLAQEAQNTEADIIFTNLPECECFTVHDSIYVTDKELGQQYCNKISETIPYIHWHYSANKINFESKLNNIEIEEINIPERKIHKQHTISDKSIRIKEYFKQYINEGLTKTEIILSLNISESYYYELKRKLKISENNLNYENTSNIYLKSKKMIVLFESDYEVLLNRISEDDFVLIPTYTFKNKHLKHNVISTLYFYFINTQEEYILPLNHYDRIYRVNQNDIINHINCTTKTKYIINKKSILYSFPKIKNCIDVELCNYLFQLKFDLDYNFPTRISGALYPLMKWMELCQNIKNNIISNISLFNKISNTKTYKFYANQASPVFQLLESTGLNIDKTIFNELFPEKINHLNDKNNLIYSSYNLYTLTGRPSNTFSNFNFAALNKSNETRTIFNSRFENGELIEFDYSAFHPHLILDLIGHSITENNIYDHLAKYFYDTPVLTTAEHDEVKSITFQLLYGGITKDFEIIPFFQKTNIYINNKWDEYNSKSFIKSPISERLLHKKFFKEDPNFNKYKLWNYLIQLLETEHNILVLKDILKLLHNKKYQSKLILYTYDSFLFDFNPIDNKEEFLNNLNEIITQNNKFPVTIKTGINYKLMNKLIN